MKQYKEILVKKEALKEYAIEYFERNLVVGVSYVFKKNHLNDH